MRNVRKVGFLCVVLAAVGFAGCGTDPAQRIELYHQQLATFARALQDSDARIAALQAAIDQGAQLLSDPNMAGQAEQAAIAERVEQIRRALEKAMVAKGEIQAWIASTEQAIAQAQAAGPVDLSGELGLIGQAVTQGGGAIGGPIGAYVGIGGLVISLLGNVVQKRSSSALKAATRAIVQGVEAAPQKAAEDVKGAIEAKMKAAGVFDQANAIVDAIKGA